MAKLFKNAKSNPHEAGREDVTFTIHLDINSRAVQQHYASDESAEALLQNEFESWLESLPYIQDYAVRKRT